MCQETRRFLAELDEMGDITLVRERFNQIVADNPFVLATHKGMSLARPVLLSLLDGREPARPTLLSSSPEEPSPWEVTKAFLRTFGVAEIHELPISVQIQQLDAEVYFEDVFQRDQLTEVERAYSKEHFVLPGVRVRFIPNSPEASTPTTTD